MNTIDRINALHTALRLSQPDPTKRRKREIPHGKVHESIANQKLRQIENRLNIVPCHRAQLGTRLTAAEVAFYSPRPFARGERVVYIGTTVPQYTGRTGVLSHPAGSGWMVRLDGETEARFFPTTKLQQETHMTTIVNRVIAAVAQFVGVSTPTNANQAARELAAATKLASEGERLKKRAKDALQRLGIILPEYRPGTVLAFEDSQFRIEAVTKEPGERLDEEAMRDELRSAGLSRAVIDRCFVAARRENKAATSIVVTEL